MSNPDVPPPTNRLLRWIRYLFLAIIVLVTFVALGVAWINWRGENAWKDLRAKLTAKGEPITLKEIAPPMIPADQNLAMIPLFAPLFDYETPSTGPTRWKDREAFDRLVGGEVLSIASKSKEKKDRLPRDGKWKSGELTDLVAWQDYFAGCQDFPQPKQPGSPGKDILVALGRDKEALAELRDGLTRPSCRFPIHYDDANVMTTLLPHLAVLKRGVSYLRLSSLAHLSEHDPASALADLKMAFRLSQAVEQEPWLISFLVRCAMLQTISQSIWEGAVHRQWDRHSLDVLQEALESTDILRHAILSMRGERATANSMYERWVGSSRSLRQDAGNFNNSTTESDPATGVIALFVPRGLLRQNQVVQNLYVTEVVDALKGIRKPDGGYQPIDQSEIAASLKRYLEVKSINNILARLLAPALDKAILRTVDAVASRDVVLVAIALERYRLAKGELPPHLSALAPDWLKTVPGDVFSGQPLKYQKKTKDTFILYSVGPNGQDDGGEWPPASKGDRSSGGLSDDLVWRYPKE